MNSIGSSPFGFNPQAMAQRQQTIAQAQLDYQKQSDTDTKAQETEAGGGATGALFKGIKGAKDLGKKIKGGADSVKQLADNLEGRFNQLSSGMTKASQMGQQLQGQLTGKTKPTPSNGEDFDIRDANKGLPSGVKPLNPGEQGGLGESEGTIAQMKGADFSSARGQIQTTLGDKYEALKGADKLDFDQHMASNMRPGGAGTQYNLDLASQKLDQLSANPKNLRAPGTSRSLLGRAQGDMDGTTNPGGGLAGSSTNRTIAGSTEEDLSSNPFSQAKTLGQKVLGGATNLHQDVSDGVAQAGRMAQNTAQKVGDTVGDLSKGLDAGMGAMEGIVDSLGPIGDIIGLGMAIFGGVKAHEEHKEEEASAQKQQSAINALPTTQSVNTSSVGVGGSVRNPLQGQSMGHY